MENETQTPKKGKGMMWTIIIIVVIILLVVAQKMQTKNTFEPASVPTENDAYSTSTIPTIIPPTTPPPGEPISTSTTTTNLKNNMHTVTIETNKGTIIFETYDADAPLASANFVKLAEKGFYNSTIFHRVIKGFMIQGGDPTGTGMGGPGYKFSDELNPATASYKAGYTRGTVAMANSGPNTNGSQFFIMHADYPLPNNYTIFGKVVKGIDIVDAIATTPTGANYKPVTDVVMKKVTVVGK